MRLGIVISRFNEDITGRMKKKAVATAKKHNLTIASIIEVPGAFDLPFAAKRMLEEGSVDAIAALGAVIKGDTDHDDLICRVAADKLASLSLEYGKPVSLGIIGPGATEEMASKRAEEYAQRAVETAIEMQKLR